MQFHNVYDVNFHSNFLTRIYKLLTNITLFLLNKKTILKKARPYDFISYQLHRQVDEYNSSATVQSRFLNSSHLLKNLLFFVVFFSGYSFLHYSYNYNLLNQRKVTQLYSVRINEKERFAPIVLVGKNTI